MENNDHNISVIVLQSAIGDDEKKLQWEAFVSRFSRETSYTLHETNNPKDADFVFLATGGVEQRFAAHYREMPRAIYAPRLTNAFAAMNEIRGYLAKYGENAFCYDESRLSLAEFASVAKAARRLRQTKIAMFGAPAPWLIASFPSRDLLQNRFHITLQYEAWDVLSWKTENAGQSSIEQDYSAKSDAVDNGDLQRACSLSNALIGWANAHHVDAVTVGCFPLLAHHVSACLAVSDLLDAGYAAACENDICSVMAMLVAQYLGICSQPPWMANLVDIQNDRITLQHCTIAKNGLMAWKLMTHFESGANVAIAGTLNVSAPVTVFRFSEDFTKACIVEGQISESGPNPMGCRTSATVRLKAPFPAPLGNHHILVMGHVAHILCEFCRMMNIEPTVS